MWEFKEWGVETDAMTWATFTLYRGLAVADLVSR